jgi:uncharacterized protein YjbI with pentapeptide repeats
MTGLEPRPYSDRELTLAAITLTFQRARAAQRELTGPPTPLPGGDDPWPSGATQLDTAELHRPDLLGSAADDAEVDGAERHRARLDDAELEDAELDDAELDDAEVDGAERHRARLNDAELDDAELDDAEVDGAGGHRARLDDAELDDAELDDAELDGGALAGDAGAEAELPNPIVTDANLRHYLDQATRFQGDASPPTAGGRRARLIAVGPRRLDQTRYNTAMVHAIHQLDHRTRLQQRTIARLEAELADTRRALAALEVERGSSS